MKILDINSRQASLHQALQQKGKRWTCRPRQSWGDPQPGLEHHPPHQLSLQLHPSTNFHSYPAQNEWKNKLNQYEKIRFKSYNSFPNCLSHIISHCKKKILLLSYNERSHSFSGRDKMIVHFEISVHNLTIGH